MYSLGILLVDLMKGRHSDPSEEDSKSSKGQVSVSKDTRELIAILIQLDPVSRVQLQDVKNHRVIYYIYQIKNYIFNRFKDFF